MNTYESDMIRVMREKIELQEQTIEVLQNTCSNQEDSIKLCKQIIHELEKSTVLIGCSRCDDTGYLKDQVYLSIPPKPIPCDCLLGEHRKAGR